MKTTNYLKKIVFATFCCLGLTANAVDVGDFNGLKTEYAASQLAAAGTTTTITLTASITIDEDIDLIPATDHPVIIDAGANKIIIQVTNPNIININFGGALVIQGTAALIATNGTGTKNIAIDGGTYSTSGSSTLIQLPNTNATLTVKDGTFSVGTGTSARAFQVQNVNSKVIFNKGTVTVGNGGRGFHVNPGSVQINGGSFTMGGTGTGSQIFRLEGSSGINVEINDGTFDAGGGNVIGFASASTTATAIVRKMTATTTGNIYAKNAAPTGTQLIYDFRAFTITPTPVAGIYTFPLDVTLASETTTTGIDPVDAVGATMVYTIDGTDPVATSTAYSAAINLTEAATLNVTMLKDGFVGTPVEFVFDKATSLNEVASPEANPYIQNGTLYLSEAASSVSIIDFNGQTLITASNEQTIDVSSLTNGIYIVKIGDTVYKLAK